MLGFEHRLRLRVPGCVLVQLAEDGGTVQVVALAGVIGIDRLPPACAVLLVDKLRHRNLGEIRVSEKLGAVEESPAEGLDGQVHRLRRAVAELGQVVAFQNIENLDKGNTARRGRRGADNFVSAIGAVHRLAFLHLVVRQIVRGDQAAVLLDVRS